MLTLRVVSGDAVPVIRNARCTTTSAPANASVEGRGIPDVSLAVGHLRPTVLGGIEGSPGDPDDPADAVVGLEQRDEREPEGAGRAGHSHGEPVGCRPHPATIPGHPPPVPLTTSPRCASPTIEHAAAPHLFDPQNPEHPEVTWLMSGIRWERWAPASGIVYVVLAQVGPTTRRSSLTRG